ncbi:interleukin-2 receptor subunit beta [Aulostomus maculatus]
MAILWSSVVLAVLLSVRAAHSHTALEGLSCVNDFVRSVSCTLNGTHLDAGADCWIFGWRKIKKIKKNSVKITQSCKLKKDVSPPGCSFAFENNTFSPYEILPNISVECDGTLVCYLKDYNLRRHIKMNPPGVPNISRTDNETLIWWSHSSPLSRYLVDTDFQVQITQNHPMRSDPFYTKEPWLRVPAGKLKGKCLVQVRVKPRGKGDSHWSDWSRATSWPGEDAGTGSQNEDQLVGQSWMLQAVMLSSALISIVMLVLYKICVWKGLFKGKPVPNPSKYFKTLHSVHRGNLKKWLNPLSASASFFTTQPCDYISPVEVCESWDVVPAISPSPSSNNILIFCRSHPTASSDTSGVVDNSSSSSSSSFSNMGYFVSGSSSSSVQTDSSLAYFTYQGDFNNLHNNQSFQLPLPTRPCITPTDESLKREPQIPVLLTGNKDEELKEDKPDSIVEEESDNHSTSFLRLPLHLPVQMYPPSTPPILAQMSSEGQQVDQPVAVAGGGVDNSGWPVTCAMYRSSSMPVESIKKGYFILKDLQTTFSSESI